jgi:hypothetical protein
MSALFTPPRYSPMSGNGASYPGAKLYFYTTGTTTPKNTYADSGLVTPNANPVVADGNGLFGSIYLAAGDYKVILKDSSDNTIWTVDPLSGLGAADSLTTRGDLLTRDATGYKRLAVGTSGQVLGSNGVDVLWVTPVSPRSAVQGLTYANNATDATNDIDIAVGSAMDATNTVMMVLGSALTKRLDAAWAVGNNQGGLDTGSIADTDYYIWLINRPDTDVTDILFSTSATSPTMPTSYTYKRLIGWFKRVSSAIVAFTTYEGPGGALEFKWKAPTLDVSLTATLTNTRRLDALKVPLTFSVEAILRAEMFDASNAAVGRVCCPDETDSTTVVNTAPLNNLFSNPDTYAAPELRVRTNSSGQVASRATGPATIDTYYIATVGFVWARR